MTSETCACVIHTIVYTGVATLTSPVPGLPTLAVVATCLALPRSFLLLNGYVQIANSVIRGDWGE